VVTAGPRGTRRAEALEKEQHQRSDPPPPQSLETYGIHHTSRHRAEEIRLDGTNLDLVVRKYDLEKNVPPIANKIHGLGGALQEDWEKKPNFPAARAQQSHLVSHRNGARPEFCEAKLSRRPWIRYNRSMAADLRDVDPAELRCLHPVSRGLILISFSARSLASANPPMECLPFGPTRGRTARSRS
jgi:hypothetical protein